MTGPLNEALEQGWGVQTVRRRRRPERSRKALTITGPVDMRTIMHDPAQEPGYS
jgi:hypothetical protein